MFKKPIKISAQNQLSGKDRKTMKNKLTQSFNQHCIDKILQLNDKLVSCKISGLKSIIYMGNDYPIFVDGTGKNDYFPTIYTLIAYQTIAAIVDINEGVENYIYNGANLMWPGVVDLKKIGQFAKDQVVGIRSAKGDLIAVGAMGCGYKDIATKDNSGVAVYILHYLGDKLWDQGAKTKPEVVISAPKPKIEQVKVEEPKIEIKAKGKKQQKTEKVQKKEEEGKQRIKDKKEEQRVKDKKKDEQKGGKKTQKKKESSSQKQKSQKQSQSDGEVDFSNLLHSKKEKPIQPPIQKIQKKGPTPTPKVFSDEEEQTKKPRKKQTKKQPKKQNKKQEHKKQQNKSQQQIDNSEDDKKQGQQQKSAVSTKLMDKQFKQVFLNVLKISKVQNELPIDSGRFFMDFMLLARPAGIKLQIKDTSYKKLGKFYQQMNKNKLIEFKHNRDKKGQQGSSIVKILWDNQELKNYQPTILRMNQRQIQDKEQQVNLGKKKLKLTHTLQVQTAYKLHQNFKNAIYGKKINYAPTEEQQKIIKKEEEDARNLPEFYNELQVRAFIQKYINDKLVSKKDRKQEKDKQQKQEKQEKQQKDKQQKDKQQKDKKDKKIDKMINIEYKNNDYLANLLKKEIQILQQNNEIQKQPQSGEDQGKRPKKKKNNLLRMERGTLVTKILKTCSTSYQIRDLATNTQSFHEGTFKGIQLVAQKSNNKNLTKIIGIETFIIPRSESDEQINWFASFLKQKFACSVNIMNLPGRNAGKEIIVHGNFINELEELFTQQYKINEQYIATQNKLDKKKKR